MIEPFDFDLLVGAGEDPVADALAYFRRIGPMARLAAAMDDGAKAAFTADLARVVAAHRRHDGIVFRAAAWLVGSRA